MKKTIKVFLVLLSLCLLAALLPVFSGAADTGAYAVYNNTGETTTLIFLRGEMLEDGVKRTEDGVTYPGTVYSSFETRTFLNEIRVPWNSVGSTVNTVTFLDTITPKCTAYWFSSFSNVQNFVGIDKLDTTNVTSMTNMFYGCSALESLDIDCWGEKVANVTNMSYMFYNCSKLGEMSFSTWDPQKLETTEYMFYNCSQLHSVDFGGFSSNVIRRMTNMLYGCTALCRMKFGENFQLSATSNPGLPSVPTTPPYTGCWTNLEGVKHYISSSLLVNYTLSSPNYFTAAGKTWVWETEGMVRSLENAVVFGKTVTYTGEALTPVITVKLDDITLTENEDFTVTGYEGNVNAGRYAVYVEAAGTRYEGEATGYFTIQAKSIQTAEIQVEYRQQYTGDKIIPDMVLSFGDTVLVKDVDYEVTTGSMNTVLGNAKVTVKGIGNYSGSRDVSFNIVSRELFNTDVTGADVVFTGEALTTTLTAHINGKDFALTEGKDYSVNYYSDNINAGTGRVHITGKGNYTGSTDALFTIQPRSITEATIGGIAVSYSGEPLETTGTGKYGKYILEQGRDLEVIGYENNVAIGTGTIIVSGIGNFKDSASGTFTILPMDLSTAEVYAENQKYTGSALTPPVTVVFNGVEIDPENYTVTYRNNIEAGTADITIVGKGECRGMTVGSFKIEKEKVSLWERILAFFRKILAFFKGGAN